MATLSERLRRQHDDLNRRVDEVTRSWFKIDGEREAEIDLAMLLCWKAAEAEINAAITLCWQAADDLDTLEAALAEIARDRGSHMGEYHADCQMIATAALAKVRK